MQLNLYTKHYISRWYLLSPQVPVFPILLPWITDRNTASIIRQWNIKGRLLVCVDDASVWLIPEMLDNHEGEEEKPPKKKRKLSTSQDNNTNSQDTSFIKVLKQCENWHDAITVLFFLVHLWLMDIMMCLYLIPCPEPVGLIHRIHLPTTGGNWIKVTSSRCHMQSPWTQAGLHGALWQESHPGPYGCRITSGGHSNLEQSAMVSYRCFQIANQPHNMTECSQRNLSTLPFQIQDYISLCR